MVTFSRRGKILITASLLLVAFGGYLMMRQVGVGDSKEAPVAFSEARLQGAVISQNIIILSQQAADELITISKLEGEGNVEEALQRTATIVGQSQKIRDNAVQLSVELDTMTRALTSIKSVEAQQAALEAINSWLSLISHLVNYSGYLGNLMDELRGQILGTSDEAKVNELIDSINAEVREINDLDTRARKAIERFDKLVGE